MSDSKAGWILGALAAAGAIGGGVYWYMKKKKEEEEEIPGLPPPTPPAPPKASILSVNIIPDSLKGTTLVEVDVINKGTSSATFYVGVSMAFASHEKWYDVGYYIDGKGDYAQIKLAPGEHGVVSRKLGILLKDVWVTVRDPDNMEPPLAEVVKPIPYVAPPVVTTPTPTPPPAVPLKASIGWIVPYPRRTYPDISVEADIWNNSTVTATFNVGMSIGSRALNKWFDVGYYADGKGDYAQVTLGPGKHAVVSRRFYPMPSMVTDVWVTVKDQNLKDLAEAFVKVP